jgi:DNA-binding NtrC family response regulator
MKIYFVDDLQENRETWFNSFSNFIKKKHELKTFESVPCLIQELEQGIVPEILFLDFFIQSHSGLEVIQYLKKQKYPLPLLIAHSSLEVANEAMLRAGAHLTLKKIKGVPQTESIQTRIQSEEDLIALLKYKDQAQGVE